MSTLATSRIAPTNDPYLAKLNRLPPLSLSIPQPTMINSHTPLTSIGNSSQPRTTRRPTSATSPLSLGSVPEDARPPASAYTRDKLSYKGKERETQDAGGIQKKARADWVLDLLEANQGAEKWAEKERVVLVIGSESLPYLSPVSELC
jgi:hypothetical protein